MSSSPNDIECELQLSLLSLSLAITNCFLPALSSVFFLGRAAICSFSRVSVNILVLPFFIPARLFLGGAFLNGRIYSGVTLTEILTSDVEGIFSVSSAFSAALARA